jgi:putative membrane protein
LIIAMCLGLALAVYLIVASGADEVARAMLLIGWGLVPIALYHLVPMTLGALSWFYLLPRKSRLGIGPVIGIRWLRESINSLLPVAGVGGDLVAARLTYLRGVPGGAAAGSIVVDITVGVATQMVFVMIGLALLVIHSHEPAVLTVAWAVLAGIGLFFVAIVVFLVVQHRGMFEVSARLAGGLLKNGRLLELAGKASAIDAAVVAIYRDRPRFWRANLVRLLGWAAGAGEIWLTLYFIGQPIGLVEAFILESLGAGVRAAAFMVPGAIGVLEASYIVFGGLFGLPVGTALAISLSKRVRELGLGIPGLLVWQWIEGRHLLRRRRAKGAAG